MSLFGSRYRYVDRLRCFGRSIDQARIRTGSDDDQGRAGDPVHPATYRNEATTVHEDGRAQRQHGLRASDETGRSNGKKVDFAACQAQRLEFSAGNSGVAHRMWLLPEMVM